MTMTQKYQYSQADGEAGPAAQRLPGVIGERSRRGIGGRHLAQHAHDHHDQHAGHGVRDERPARPR